jgi:hypothetical protein
MESAAETAPEMENYLSNLIEYAGFEIVVLAVALSLTGVIGYSLITTGKRGWGWFSLCVVAATLAFFFRIAISMFVEMSVATGPNDWDED